MEVASDERLRSARGRHHHDVSGWLARSALCAALKAPLTCEPRLRFRAHLGECTSQLARLVHSHLFQPLPFDAEDR